MKRVALLTVALLFATTMAYAGCGFCQLAKGKKSEDWVQEKMRQLEWHRSMQTDYQ